MTLSVYEISRSRGYDIVFHRTGIHNKASSCCAEYELPARRVEGIIYELMLQNYAWDHRDKSLPETYVGE